MTIKVDVSSFGKLTNAMNKLHGRGEATPAKALARLALMIQGNAVRLIQGGSKTGEIYGNHQASSPGEAPASDTGNLAKSIAVTKVDKETVLVSARAPYAAYLEFGTKKIEARPFMTPAFVQAVPSLKSELWKAWKEQKEALSKGD